MSISTPASRVALMLGMLQGLLAFLQDQVWNRIDEKMYMTGSFMSCWMSKLKRRICSDWRPGEITCIQFKRKFPEEELFGH